MRWDMVVATVMGVLLFVFGMFAGARIVDRQWAELREVACAPKVAL